MLLKSTIDFSLVIKFKFTLLIIIIHLSSLSITVLHHAIQISFNQNKIKFFFS